jgi:hypothetical protein
MHLFRRADELDEDLLHGFLVGLKMLSEMMADLPAVAAYCYRIVFFDREVRDPYTSAMLGKRRRFRSRLDSIVARYQPRILVDLDYLADMLSAITQGDIIVSKVVNDKNALPRQLMLYHDFVRAIFLGT